MLISLLQIKRCNPGNVRGKGEWRELVSCDGRAIEKCNLWQKILKFKMGFAISWPTMGRFTNSYLLVVVLFLCRTIVCDSQCPKYAEKPLETRVQDASIVFRAVVVQTHYQVSLFCYCICTYKWYEPTLLWCYIFLSFLLLGSTFKKVVNRFDCGRQSTYNVP